MSVRIGGNGEPGKDGLGLAGSSQKKWPELGLISTESELFVHSNLTNLRENRYTATQAM